MTEESQFDGIKPRTPNPAPAVEGYQLLGTIGQGGMGTVFKARHLLTGRLTALKLINSNLADERVLRRFQQEAKALCALTHPNVISVYHFGVTAEGQPFLSMEYVNGVTLSDLISKGPLAWNKATKIFVQIAEALQHAHRQGVIHRDLKPSNVMVVETGGHAITAKILDFGIAKVIHDESLPSPSLTATGDVIGSPLYMSPEQCSGLKVDSRTDIYSLGCLMYETLTGHPPHTGDNPLSIVVKHLHDQPAPFAEALPGNHIPQALEKIVFKALIKDPNSRYKTMTALQEELSLLTDKRLIKRLRHVATTSVPFQRAWLPAAAVTTLIAAAIVAFSLFHFPTTPPATPFGGTAGSTAVRNGEVSGSAPTNSGNANTAGVIPNEVAARANKNRKPAVDFLALEKNIEEQTPLSAPELTKDLVSSAIVSADTTTVVHRKGNTVSVDLSNFTGGAREVKGTAIAIAMKIGQMDARINAVKVVALATDQTRYVVSVGPSTMKMLRTTDPTKIDNKAMDGITVSASPPKLPATRSTIQASPAVSQVNRMVSEPSSLNQSGVQHPAIPVTQAPSRFAQLTVPSAYSRSTAATKIPGQASQLTDDKVCEEAYRLNLINYNQCEILQLHQGHQSNDHLKVLAMLRVIVEASRQGKSIEESRQDYLRVKGPLFKHNDEEAQRQAQRQWLVFCDKYHLDPAIRN